MEVKNCLLIGLLSLAIVSTNGYRTTPTTTTTAAESPARSSLLGDIFSIGASITGTVSDTVKEIPSILLDGLIERENITFNLYTKSNVNESYKLNEENIKNSLFDPSLQTKVIIHKSTDNSTEALLDHVRVNYLTNSKNYNVIWINWKSDSTDVTFPSLINDIKKVGQEIGEFLGSISRSFLFDLTKVHLIGHGFNAHVAGYTGHYIIANRIGKIGRVTGLDPIGMQNGNDRVTNDVLIHVLDSSDAKFVDVIHTCNELNRFGSAIGHVDIYPNGGFCKQPGCPAIVNTQDICGHKRSIEIFRESINDPNSFVATRCDNWTNYKSKRCVNNVKIYAGEYIVPGTTGHYFFETNEVYPFGKGLDAVYKFL